MTENEAQDKVYTIARQYGLHECDATWITNAFLEEVLNESPADTPWEDIADEAIDRMTNELE